MAINNTIHVIELKVKKRIISGAKLSIDRTTTTIDTILTETSKVSKVLIID